jgi:hypothetical protein
VLSKSRLRPSKLASSSRRKRPKIMEVRTKLKSSRGLTRAGVAIIKSQTIKLKFSSSKHLEMLKKTNVVVMAIVMVRTMVMIMVIVKMITIMAMNMIMIMRMIMIIPKINIHMATIMKRAITKGVKKSLQGINMITK